MAVNRSYRVKFTALYLWILIAVAGAPAQDPLPSWNDGLTKQAILTFVHITTDRSSPNFVPPEQRIAVFDQDGTTWVEQPLYTQVLFALERVVELAPKHPEWKTKQPFQTVLSGDKAAIARLTPKDLEAIVLATHAGMTVEQFNTVVNDWIAKDRKSTRLNSSH